MQDISHLVFSGHRIWDQWPALTVTPYFGIGEYMVYSSQMCGLNSTFIHQSPSHNVIFFSDRGWLVGIKWHFQHNEAATCLNITILSCLLWQRWKTTIFWGNAIILHKSWELCLQAKHLTEMTSRNCQRSNMAIIIARRDIHPCLTKINPCKWSIVSEIC